MPANESYQHYSDLKRPYVTWNVIATKPLSMTPSPSCFPVVGCLSYRGYFKEAAANNYANKLAKQGLETYIAGSSAYSTLGWFDDPVVSTMLRYDDYFLLETLFHELAHQKIYFPNDSDFNEAFASAVGQFGVRQWLAMHGTQKDIQDYELHLKRRKGFTTLLRDKADELRRTFAQNDKSAEQLSKEKIAVYAKLKGHYQRYKQTYAYDGYDNWFLKPVNNPRLAIVSTYHGLVPAFMRHLRNCDNNLQFFYRSISTLRILTPRVRKDFLLNSNQCKIK